MTPFFATELRRKKLCLEAAKWIGTPFHAHAAIRGAGVDCVNLIAQLLVACGHAQSYEMPKYVMDGGKHNATSQLTDYLDSRDDFARVVDETLPIWKLPAWGDVLCFTLGRSSHHCGLMLHGKIFVHALYGRKVEIVPLVGIWPRSLDAIYRPLEVPR